MKALLLTSISLFLLIMAASCGNDSCISDAYRYDHVADFARRYAESLTDPTLSDTDKQFRLLDIRSREQALRQRGDSLLADYFIVAIEENLYDSSWPLAEELFGPRLTSSFFR